MFHGIQNPLVRRRVTHHAFDKTPTADVLIVEERLGPPGAQLVQFIVGVASTSEQTYLRASSTYATIDEAEVAFQILHQTLATALQDFHDAYHTAILQAQADLRLEVSDHVETLNAVDQNVVEAALSQMRAMQVEAPEGKRLAATVEVP